MPPLPYELSQWLQKWHLPAVEHMERPYLFSLWEWGVGWVFHHSSSHQSSSLPPSFRLISMCLVPSVVGKAQTAAITASAPARCCSESSLPLKKAELGRTAGL